MSTKKKTRKIIRLDDSETAIGYKIIHCLPADNYEIWTYYRSKSCSNPLRNKICTDEALKLQYDVDGLIKYVENTLIKQHYNFYANGFFEQNRKVSTGANTLQICSKPINKTKER